jgi:SpoVK/Ycf46/Vps4 family AAA+-type ATPase
VFRTLRRARAVPRATDGFMGLDDKSKEIERIAEEFLKQMQSQIDISGVEIVQVWLSAPVVHPDAVQHDAETQREADAAIRKYERHHQKRRKAQPSTALPDLLSGELLDVDSRSTVVPRDEEMRRRILVRHLRKQQPASTLPDEELLQDFLESLPKQRRKRFL